METGNPKLEIRNSKIETRNSKLEIRDSKLDTRNSKFETRNWFKLRGAQIIARLHSLWQRLSNCKTSLRSLRSSSFFARLRSLWKRISNFKSQLFNFPIPTFNFQSSIFRALSRFPWRFPLAALSLLVAALWLIEHDARVRRDAQLDVLRRDTAGEVASLRFRAEAAMKEFRASARLIDQLEARGRVLESEAVRLRQKLSSLRSEEKLRVQQAVIPGSMEMPSGSAPLLDSGERPQPIAGFRASLDPRFRGDDSRRDGAGPGRHSRESGNPPEPRTPNAESRACEQSAVQDQLIANCEQRVGVTRAALEAAKKSALDLQTAMRAKDEIAAKLEAEHRAEIKAARGSRVRRFGRALEYVGAGVIVGVAIAH